MQQFTTYIIFSKSLDAFYIGSTGLNVSLRLAKHLSNHDGFTAKAKDWKIVYTEIFQTKKESILREKQLKGWKNKLRIQQLIIKGSTE